MDKAPNTVKSGSYRAAHWAALLAGTACQSWRSCRPSPSGRRPATRPALSGPLSVCPDTACRPFLAGSRGWPPSRLGGILKRTLKYPKRWRSCPC